MKTKTIKLTGEERNYLVDILLKQMEVSARILRTQDTQKDLKKIGKDQVYTIYQKII